MLFNRPVSGSVSIIISAYDVDWTCFVSEAFSYNLHIIHVT